MTDASVCSGDRERNFAERLVGLEALMSLGDLLEWEDGIDYGLNTSIGQQRHNFLSERGGNCDLLFQRACAQDGSDDMKTFSQDLVEVDLGFTSGDSADEDDAATQRHRFEARGEVWTTI